MPEALMHGLHVHPANLNTPHPASRRHTPYRATTSNPVIALSRTSRAFLRASGRQGKGGRQPITVATRIAPAITSDSPRRVNLHLRHWLERRRRPGSWGGAPSCGAVGRGADHHGEALGHGEKRRCRNDGVNRKLPKPVLKLNACPGWIPVKGMLEQLFAEGAVEGGLVLRFGVLHPEKYNQERGNRSDERSAYHNKQHDDPQ